MKKKLKATLYGTIAFVLASYVIVIAGNGYSWLTDKDHILAKQESPGAERQQSNTAMPGFRL
jgi:hypothetical protein